MRLSPDEWIFWQHGFLKLNATIAFTMPSNQTPPSVG